MPKIQYLQKKLNAEWLEIIAQANAIIAEYQEQGFDLTLRQLYYQFVARDLIANKVANYKKLGTIIAAGRLAGLVDWYAIVDRTRNLRGNNHWDSPAAIMQACASSYLIDRWATQPRRVEVWIEKDALTGVINNVCASNDIPYFSCRGYTSLSEVWVAAQRHINYKQKVIVLHLGDHDPSGIDMTRDIKDRLKMFGAVNTKIGRIALNRDQIDQFNPPPNPAKEVDPRFKKYQQEHGNESWELDALDPATIVGLIQGWLDRIRDEEAWATATAIQDKARRELKLVARHFDKAVKHLRES